MATGLTDTASSGADGLIPEVWAGQTRDSFLANLEMANLVDRSFERELQGRRGDTIHIDGAGGTTDDTRSGFDVASNITLGAGGTLTSEVITFLTQVDLTIDTHAYKFFDLEFELDLKTDFPLLQRGAERTSYVVAQKLDDDLAGLIDNFSQTVGTLAVSLSDDNLLRAVQYLNDSNSPESERFGLFSAAQQVDFMKVDKYINKMYEPLTRATANPEEGRFRGQFGSLYGITLVQSTNTEGTNAAGHDNGIWQREVIAAVVVDDQRVAVDYEISTDSHRHAVHSLYGHTEVRDTSGVWLKGL